MRTLLLILFLTGAGRLSAQQKDTVFYESGPFKYAIYDKAKWKAGNGEASFYNSNDVLKQTWPIKNKRKDGVVRYYYDNGQLQAECPYKKGLFDGVVRSYYSNGKVEWTKPYRKGKLYGARMLLDSTGVPVTGDNVAVQAWGDVKITSHCVNGRPEGKVVLTSKGKILFVGNYTNGMPDGDYVYYNAAGTPVQKDIYKKGRFIKSVELNE